MRARLPFYADLAARGLDAFRDRALRDFRLLVADGRDPRRAVATVQRWPDLFTGPYRAELARLPVRELRRHYRAADEAELDIGQPKRPWEIVPFLDPPPATRQRP